MRAKADKRIAMRTNSKIKHLLEAAAALAGFNSLSSFILSVACKEAQNIINEAKGRILSDRDRDNILAALENPPMPNANLQSAMIISKDNNN